MIYSNSESDSDDSDCIVVSHQKAQVRQQDMPPADVEFPNLPSVSEVQIIEM